MNKLKYLSKIHINISEFDILYTVMYINIFDHKMILIL